MFFLNFVSFLTSRTRLRISKFHVYLAVAKKSDRREVLERLYYIINGICADGEQTKAFWFSEGRMKV